MRSFRASVFLCAVSPLALFAGSQDVHAQSSNLPAVTITAPTQQSTRRVQRATRPAAATNRRIVRREAPALQPVALVAYVTPSTGTLGAPPAPYAGGQVATGGQLGFLGTRGVMNTPFNQTSYTAELIQNQQARTIADVLLNDPSVRVVSTAGGGQDVYFIRGFYYDPGDIALNGLYGIAPNYSVAANFVERVEVLKGPAALLTGMPPGGAIGGSINLISKKALPYDLTQLTMGYISKSQFGANLDISRRYGEFKEYGIRYNGGYRNGATAFDRQTDEYANSHLGVDYTGERLRVSADVGYQAENLQPANRFVSFFLPANTPIPPAPRAGSTFIVPWAYYRPRDFFVAGRAEVDITDWATVYGAIGYHDSKIDFISVAPNIFNAAGDYQSRPFKGFSEFRTTSGEIGVRANVDTGPVNHALNVNYTVTNRPNDNVFAVGTTIFSNIYNPLVVPEQNPSAVLVRNVLTTNLSSIGFADTMSVLDKRVQFTAGVRRQTVGSDTLNLLNGATTTYEQSVWSPAFALLVKPVENLSLYANYIEGLQVGSTVGAGFANVGTVFPPFQSKQAEVGAKVNFGRITTTFSLFQISQPALVTVAAAVPTQELAGEQRNRGAELNVFGEVTPDIRLLGGVAFIDGRLTKTENGLQDNNKALGVPVVNLSVGAEWDTPFLRGLTLTGRTIYTSQQFVNTANTQVLPDWVRFDIGARYAFISPWNGKPIIVRAAIENVGNASYWASAYNGVVALGAPRTYLVSTTFNF